MAPEARASWLYVQTGFNSLYLAPSIGGVVQRLRGVWPVFRLRQACLLFLPFSRQRLQGLSWAPIPGKGVWSQGAAGGGDGLGPPSSDPSQV